MMSVKQLFEEEDRLVQEYNTSKSKMTTQERINLKASIRLARRRIADALDPDKDYNVKGGR